MPEDCSPGEDGVVIVRVASKSTGIEPQDNDGDGQGGRAEFG